jgi:DNA-binding response OmpR family regulator
LRQEKDHLAHAVQADIDLDRGMFSLGATFGTLTPVERRLLARLSDGQVHSRADLARTWENAVSERTVDRAIARLRHKIEPDPRRSRTLLSVRGEGYTWVRTQRVVPAETAPSSSSILDVDTLDLTELERRLFRHLWANQGRSLPYATLYRAIWGGVWVPGSRVPANAVARMRTKLPSPLADRLVTLRGLGVRLDPARNSKVLGALAWIASSGQPIAWGSLRQAFRDHGLQLERLDMGGALMRCSSLRDGLRAVAGVEESLDANGLLQRRWAFCANEEGQALVTNAVVEARPGLHVSMRLHSSLQAREQHRVSILERAAVPSAFLGRRREVDALAAALERRPQAVVWGPPGAGKTELALAYHATFRQRHDVVHCLRMAGSTDPASVIAAASSALGVRRRATANTLARVVAERGRILWIVDDYRGALSPLRCLTNGDGRLLVTRRRAPRAHPGIEVGPLQVSHWHALLAPHLPAASIEHFHTRADGRPAVLAELKRLVDLGVSTPDADSVLAGLNDEGDLLSNALHSSEIQQALIVAAAHPGPFHAENHLSNEAINAMHRLALLRRMPDQQVVVYAHARRGVERRWPARLAQAREQLIAHWVELRTPQPGAVASWEGMIETQLASNERVPEGLLDGLIRAGNTSRERLGVWSDAVLAHERSARALLRQARISRDRGEDASALLQEVCDGPDERAANQARVLMAGVALERGALASSTALLAQVLDGSTEPGLRLRAHIAMAKCARQADLPEVAAHHTACAAEVEPRAPAKERASYLANLGVVQFDGATTVAAITEATTHLERALGLFEEVGEYHQIAPIEHSILAMRMFDPVHTRTARVGLLTLEAKARRTGDSWVADRCVVSLIECNLLADDPAEAARIARSLLVNETAPMARAGIQYDLALALGCTNPPAALPVALRSAAAMTELRRPRWACRAWLVVALVSDDWEQALTHAQGLFDSPWIPAVRTHRAEGTPLSAVAGADLLLARLLPRVAHARR